MVSVAEIASPDFPGERLMVCFNPRLRDERRRKRDEFLQTMEDRLEKIARTVRETAPDGIWVVRTSLDADSIGPDEAVEAYKSLARVEQAFRQIKTERLRVRPTFVYSEALAFGSKQGRAQASARRRNRAQLR